MLSKWCAAALVVALCRTSTAQVANLQIRVVEGDGGIHAPGARSSKPLTVEVIDETGRAVPRAAVSFHLPDDGPGGIFANGLRTDVVTTDDHGRASLRGWQLNRVPGRFQIRITASKEQATAGLISFQYISEPTAGTEANNNGATRGVSHSRLKWLAIVALAGGGVAGAGLVVSRHTASTATTPVLTIGAPAITVGKP